MYKIIGADGKEYGPVSKDQVHAWIAEGRASVQTLVQAENTTDWKPLANFPELLPAAVPPPPAGLVPVPVALCFCLFRRAITTG